ncbi:pirin family protein [Streptomyces sp. BR123]|uniref:pirin family protein n=1 Tax=Streptomyces sp. BR123 TaxID=2749828 RepID=UPI0015C49626|nr:pirin-like C-terminal cupin domain-containing protein [Streptomyces sp. BR123]NXY95793.1 pirin family protein [Streptomyces sp. BR123]
MDITTTAVRSTARVFRPFHTFEGEGFPVRRPFPQPGLPLVDPFLVVDQVGPHVLGPGEAKGTPPLPHRGFETIRYVIDGGVEDIDSAGNERVMNAGEVRWLTAGSGLVHLALPAPELLAGGGPQHLLQIWVNLPARLKATPPRVQYGSVPHGIPTVSTEDGTAELTVIAGSTHGATGPFETHTPVLVVHARLAAGGRAEFAVPAGHNAMLYVLSGTAATPDAGLPDGHLAVLARDGERFAVSAPGDAAEVLVLAGEPIGEPVARTGPFVMNTAAEIRQAQFDYQHGLMGRIAV